MAITKSCKPLIAAGISWAVSLAMLLALDLIAWQIDFVLELDEAALVPIFGEPDTYFDFRSSEFPALITLAILATPSMLVGIFLYELLVAGWTRTIMVIWVASGASTIFVGSCAALYLASEMDSEDYSSEALALGGVCLAISCMALYGIRWIQRR